MKYFISSQYNDTISGLEMITIGILKDDDSIYYATNSEFNSLEATEEVMTNVIDNLHETKKRKSLETIASEIVKFIGDDDNPIFYGYCCAYTWTIFNRLFAHSTRVVAPSSLPTYCKDLKQIIDYCKIPKDEIPLIKNYYHDKEVVIWLKSVHDSIYNYLNKCEGSSLEIVYTERQPSIHVKLYDFYNMLKDILPENLNVEYYTERIFRECKSKNIVNRTYIENVSNQKAKKAELSQEISRDYVATFNSILQSIKILKGYKQTNLILKTSPDYSVLAAVAKDAEGFCKDFNYTGDKTELGMKHYIELATEIGGSKFSLNYMAKNKDKIFRRAVSISVIKEDDDAEKSANFYETWQETAESKGTPRVAIKDPDLYVNFILARKQADSMEASYRAWIEAQYSGLAWTKQMPLITQLHGQEASLRYQKYVYALTIVNTKQDTTSYSKEDKELEFMIKQMKERKRTV